MFTCVLWWWFSHEEEMELLCQGVKPWDDDAHDVMRVLSGGY
jgi:hypothetical protein